MLAHCFFASVPSSAASEDCVCMYNRRRRRTEDELGINVTEKYRRTPRQQRGAKCRTDEGRAARSALAASSRQRQQRCAVRAMTTSGRKASSSWPARAHGLRRVNERASFARGRVGETNDLVVCDRPVSSPPLRACVRESAEQCIVSGLCTNRIVCVLQSRLQNFDRGKRKCRQHQL